MNIIVKIVNMNLWDGNKLFEFLKFLKYVLDYWNARMEIWFEERG